MTSPLPERRQPALVQLRTTRSAPGESLATRARRLLPFAVVALIVHPVALILPAETVDVGLLAISMGLAALAGGLLAVEWPTGEIHGWRALATVSMVASTLLLREAGGGAETGYGWTLLVLPPVWQALYGRRVDVYIAVGVVLTALVGAALVLDGYEARTEIPRAVVVAVVGGMLSAMMVSVVTTLREHDELIARLGAVTTRLHSTEYPRPVLCDAVRQLVDAPMAVLFEHDRAGLIATGMTGSGLPSPTDPPLVAPPGAVAAVSARQVAFEGGEDEGSDRHGVVPGWPGRSRLHVPVAGAGDPQAVVTACWPDIRPAPPRIVLEALDLLAADGARAIERADLMARLAQQANRDGLTGLLNRRGWDRALHNEIAEARRSSRPVTVALVDLDHFKQFNDEHGHLAGDDLLRDAATAWTRELRTGDVLARWGGEEFTVLFPGADAEVAVRALRRLRAATPRGQRFSAGICSRREADAGELMAAADAALYRAKREGRDRIVIATELDPPGGRHPGRTRRRPLTTDGVATPAEAERNGDE